MPIADGCLEKIANPNDVNYIATQRGKKNKRLLIAGLKGGDTVPLTKPESVMTYAFEPVASFAIHLGDLYCSNFLMLDEDRMFNINNFAGFDYDFDSDKKYVGIISKFQDGTSAKLYSVKNTYFIKEEKKLSQFEQQIHKIHENEGMDM